MFCPQCGVEVADAAAFCRKCGASLRDDVAPPAPVEQQPPAQQVYQQPAPQQQVVAQQQPAATQTMRHTLGATKPVQPIIGVVAIAGAAAAALGAILPWIQAKISVADGPDSSYTLNGFDLGYITGGSIADGNDGILLIISGGVAALLAIHYFLNRNALLSLGSLVLGAAAAGVAGYNFMRLYSDIKDPLDYLSYGLYVSIAGGAIAAGAAFVGFKREGSM